MIPALFEYERARSLEDALRLARENPDAKFISGGHSLLPMMKLRLARPSRLIDIAHIPQLRAIDVESGGLTIGAGVRYYEVMSHNRIKDLLPVLAEAVSLIGDPQVRNRGTLGGSAAHADPASDLGAVLLAADAQLIVQGTSEKRVIAARDWYLAPLVTALQPEELLIGIRFPLPVPQSQRYVKYPHPASGYALAGVAVLLEFAADGSIQDARMAVTGSGEMPFRAEAAEELLRGHKPSGALIHDVARQAATEGRYQDDIGYSAQYRQHLAQVMIQRALEQLVVQ